MLLQCVTIETGAGAQHAVVVLLLVVLGVAGRDAGAVRGAACAVVRVARRCMMVISLCGYRQGRA